MKPQCLEHSTCVVVLSFGPLIQANIHLWGFSRWSRPLLRLMETDWIPKLFRVTNIVWFTYCVFQSQSEPNSKLTLRTCVPARWRLVTSAAVLVGIPRLSVLLFFFFFPKSDLIKTCGFNKYSRNVFVINYATVAGSEMRKGKAAISVDYFFHILLKCK